MTIRTPDDQLSLHVATFNQVSEGVLWADKQGRIAHANEASARLLGYTMPQLLRSSYLEIDPNYSLLGWKKFWKQLSSEGSTHLDTQFVNVEGIFFGVRGHITFDELAGDRELCLIVFSSTEEGRREADLLEAVQRDGKIGSWEYHLGTGQVFVSPLLREWLGWSLERDFYPVGDLAEKLSLHLLPSQKKEAATLLSRLTRATRAAEVTLDLQLADGQTRSLLLRGQSVENEVEVRKIYGTAVREEDHLAGMVPAGDESTFQFSLDQSRDAIVWINLTDSHVAYANARARELTRYSRQEIIGLPAKLLSNDLTTALEQLRANHYLELSTETNRKDGTAYPTRAGIHFHAAPDGQEYAVIVSHDSSRETANTEDLQLHTATLNTLQEWVIWLNNDHEIAMLNTAARRKLSRTTTLELTGLPLIELMPELEIPALAQVRQEQLDGRVRPDTDYVYADTTGKERTLQVSFVQVAAGSRMYLGVICRDVTNEMAGRRRLQEAKRRVDELRKQLESENEVLKEEIDTVTANGPIITVSKKYMQVLGQIGQVAGTDATVLVTGETGTGKELLAQSIHNFSNRGARRMVSVNCAALPENLIESELFGHERGAFTGAFAQKKGKFELADGGTIFLDEIGELPLEMQSKLLRALQEGEIQRIGSQDVIHVDVRVVAATNRNLEQMIGQGTFREDLFYRLNVFPIHNLPLRERQEDIPVLVKHFTKIYAQKIGRPVTQINQKDLEQLVAYDFPGNVRELINLVERAVITSKDSTLNLGASLRALRRTDRGDGKLSLSPNDRLVSFEEMQRQYIMEALRRTKGKVTGSGGAAELLKVNGRTLMSKMVKLGIERGTFT
ncbi:MAG: PAS domain S-box-containing protein [Neolewinella sp.]|jgi:PAS domain S-box-containing protein